MNSSSLPNLTLHLHAPNGRALRPVQTSLHPPLHWHGSAAYLPDLVGSPSRLDQCRLNANARGGVLSQHLATLISAAHAAGLV